MDKSAKGLKVLHALALWYRLAPGSWCLFEQSHTHGHAQSAATRCESSS